MTSTGAPVVQPARGNRRAGTLGDGLTGRDNALNFLRLVLAASVIFWHSYPVLGVTPTTPIPSAIGAWAVNGFFAISGYLICGSRLRLGWRPFLWRRALRIFPAFWTVLLVTGFGFAPLAAWLLGNAYDPRDGFSYVLENAALWMGQFNVGDTLAGTPHPHSWNGSLWTLFFEFGAYVAAMLLLGVALVRRHQTVVLAVILMLLTAAFLAGVGVGWAPPLDLLAQGTRLGTFFVAGMLVYTVRDQIRPSWPLALGAVATTLVATIIPGLAPLGAVPMALALLTLGVLLPTRIGSTNDISYGVYIYGFPAQQLLVAATGPAWPVWLHSLTALAVACCLAWVSWKAVEQPALRLKGMVR